MISTPPPAAATAAAAATRVAMFVVRSVAKISDWVP
eukprot:CAMPEP_0119541184 /NCGR_PEP_ID=MMETSP1344-20130328/52812_1 /TAXON_ID=236787 /ORGANISM="Florenciella parvula, Strain CCMP2471" /LENGTH=35 /DNA_ID= /DNA_START= /DNA_END= /DNA_ORIENTATION=